MSALTFRLRHSAPAGLNLAPLNPSALAGRSIEQIARLKIDIGGRARAAADFFDISGDDPTHVRLLGVTSACHNIGQAMNDGLLEIRGQVGAELGRAMRGGEIVVKGDAGDAAGMGMLGGLIRISGTAGDRVGAAIPGETRGMNNGTIIIQGDAGAHLGERMRRGLIIVAGNAGAYCGDRMVAGSIIVLGGCGPHLGSGMRRGTLILASAPAVMPATFNSCGEFALGFMPILARHVEHLDKSVGARLREFGPAGRWCGDMAHGGKGELLIATGS